MGQTVSGIFPTRREVEIAVEHLVQEYGLERSDIFIEPLSDMNSAGEAVAGADRESGHGADEADADGGPYAGRLKVSVDMNQDELSSIQQAFRDAGAVEVEFG
jgi:hypothetical protein